MESVATVGGTVINYSKRFSLTGMTGTFPQAVLDGMEDVTGLDGPPTKNDVAGQQASQTIAEGLYGVPYNEQTGPTKYCPMQPLPPTKIIKDKPTPLWPTSGVTFAKTFMPTPQQVTTLTLAQTFSVASRMNDVRRRLPRLLRVWHALEHSSHEVNLLTLSRSRFAGSTGPASVG